MGAVPAALNNHAAHVKQNCWFLNKITVNSTDMFAPKQTSQQN
jgi:hypothetical protein